MCCRTCADQLCNHIIKLLTKEYGDDCRRCFICAQSVIISDISCGPAEKICMIIYCFQDAGKYQKELNIFMRCFARL